MFESIVNDAADKVTAGVMDRLLALLHALLNSIGWGTILLIVGAIFGLILIVKLLCNVKVLAVLTVLFLIAGFCMSKGFDFKAVRDHLTPAEDVKRLETARWLTQ